MKKTTLLFACSAVLVLTSCSRTSSSHSSGAARPTTYGEATEEMNQRYGGRSLGPHPGAANYDPSTGRGEH